MAKDSGENIFSKKTEYSNSLSSLPSFWVLTYLIYFLLFFQANHRPRQSKAPRLLFLNLKPKEVLMIIRGLSDFNKKTCYKSFPFTSRLYYGITKFLCHILLTLFATKWILYDIYSVLFCSHFLPPLSIYMWWNLFMDYCVFSTKFLRTDVKYNGYF